MCHSSHAEQSLCSFRPDFERFALSLACCPDDASVLANTAAVCVGTMELRNLLDCSEECPAVFKNLGGNGRDVSRSAYGLQAVAADVATEARGRESADECVGAEGGAWWREE